MNKVRYAHSRPRPHQDVRRVYTKMVRCDRTRENRGGNTTKLAMALMMRGLTELGGSEDACTSALVDGAR